MSDSPEKEKDEMFIVYDPENGQITQIVYDAVAYGMWTRIDKEWFPLSEEDISTWVLKRKAISRNSFQEARDYFDDKTAEKILTYEPEYRMWYA